MCMFEIKCVMYKRWQILPFHAKDIVEIIKRNIKKLFKNCVCEYMVWASYLSSSKLLRLKLIYSVLQFIEMVLSLD